jgi:hypothetical protein
MNVGIVEASLGFQTLNATFRRARLRPGRSAGRGRHREALEEFTAAEHLQSRLEGSHALASQVTGWMVATQARLGMPGEARDYLAAVDDERASAGEIRNACAVIYLAEGDPAGALGAVADVLDGTAPVIGYVTVVEAHLLAGLAHRKLGDQRAANHAPSPSPRRGGLAGPAVCDDRFSRAPGGPAAA